LLSLGIAAVYWTMRIGFDDPVMPVMKPVLLALFIFTFPAVVSGSLLPKSYRIEPDAVRWWSSYPFLWLIAIGISAVLGRVAGLTGLNAFPVIAALGGIAYLILFVRWLPRSTIWRTLLLILGCGVFSVWAAGVVWGRIYKNPLFFENYILNGKVHHDSLHLASFAAMLRSYGIASTGIDGLPSIPYHWGTQWLFAQWSNLTGAHVLDFYQLGFPVTMIPFFFGGTLAFAVAMRAARGEPEANDDLRDDGRIWFVFLAACIGILPISGLDAMAVWTSNLLISESYTVAVPCALMLLAMTVIWHRSSGRSFSKTAKALDATYPLVVLPLGVALLGYLKSSLMMLAFGLALYVFVRLKLYRRMIYWYAIVVMSIAFAGTYQRVILPAHYEGFSRLDFLWNFVRPAWWPFFFVVHLFWSWVYALLRLRSEGIGTIADIRDAVSENRIVDVEAVVVVALLGLGPGMVMHLDGGSAFYFSDVQRWLAVGFILSRIPELSSILLGERAPPKPRPKRRIKLSERFDAIPARSVMIGFLLLPVVGSMLSNIPVWPVTMARENSETRHALYPASVAAGIPPGVHGLPQLTDPGILARGLSQSRNYLVAHSLKELSDLPIAEKRRTALFIPQSQDRYWKSLTREGACTFQPFVATSMSEIAMIDGMPPYGCTVNRYYGLGSFAPRSRPQMDHDSTETSLCRRAEKWGLNRVIVLTFDSTRANRNTISCPAKI
jgi:hypothetical protein